MKQDEVLEVLQKLVNSYGAENDGFHHNHPWQHLVAIMLSAQSTDKQVDAVLPALYKRFDTVEDVAKADLEEIESYIRSIGLYKNKAKNMKKCCTQISQEYGGVVPSDRQELMKLGGVGRKTANLYMANELGIPEITVDTHVHRVSNRIGWVDSKQVLETEKQLQNVLPKEYWIAINILLIRHGRAVCKSRKPACEKCFLRKYCKYNKNKSNS
ncbi:MAG: endonuclease III [Lachnospiraceae bacterium]|nr:endonuclease III [Lachnospiraceae bacterium]